MSDRRHRDDQVALATPTGQVMPFGTGLKLCDPSVMGNVQSPWQPHPRARRCTVPRVSYSLPLLGASNAWIAPPVIISVCALLFTVASFWWIQTRRGRLRLYTGHVLSGVLVKKAIVYLPFVFHNPAPATLTVADLRLNIEGGSGGPDDVDRLVPPGKLFWIASHDAVYPESGKHRQYAMPFAVEGRKAVGRVIEFQWEGQR